MDLAKVRSEVQHLLVERNSSIPPPLDKNSMNLERQRTVHRRKVRGQVLFAESDVNRFILDELTNTESDSSVVVRGAAKMADQVVVAAEILEKATQVFDAQLKKFSATSDSSLAEAKKRVSQLSDYNNRLMASLANLNKTLSDEKLARALETADKMATALKLLDDLERQGSLKKIMDALNQK